MNSGPAEDKAELIKWWDALYVALEDFPRGLHMARKCQHPDAQWLCALFPVGYDEEFNDVELEVSMREEVVAVLEAEGDDPRSLFLLVFNCHCDGMVKLQKAAELGYAPAQAELSFMAVDVAEMLAWAEKAVAQGDRVGMTRLGECLLKDLSCEENKVRAVELLKEAAQLASGALALTLDCTVTTKWTGSDIAGGPSRRCEKAIPLLLDPCLKLQLNSLRARMSKLKWGASCLSSARHSKETSTKKREECLV